MSKPIAARVKAMRLSSPEAYDLERESKSAGLVSLNIQSVQVLDYPASGFHTRMPIRVRFLLVFNVYTYTQLLSLLLSRQTSASRFRLQTSFVPMITAQLPHT